MRVGVWLLWVPWFYTWAEGSRECKCKLICPKEPGDDTRSKIHFKEHVRHGTCITEHQRMHHKSRPHRRKGSRLQVEEVPPRIVHQPSDLVVRVGNPATLSCRAEGNPEPTIQWLRNGQPLEMDKREGQSQPMVLSEGSLFFLSVVGGRRGQSHEGVYACVARNSAGKATSRNASLYIAALQEEFLVQPSDVEVAVGEMAVLNCGPPVGHPEPNVTWRKDGFPINSTDQHYTELNGKLIIGPAEKNQSGVYVCVASNFVGMRESRAARLSVLAKPVLVLRPEDVSVKAGESAQFYCQAKGDPLPAVDWSREQGALPNGRYLVNPDQSLQIHYVTVQDAGRYTCTAVNDVGVVTASAQLLVQEAVNTQQKDLHRELSALRVALDNVTIMAPASNMSLVQWKLQSLPDQPHYLDGFEVLYRCLLPASSDWAAKRVALPNFQTQVGPLKRGYKYEFKVRPYGSSLYGRESNTRHLRVPEIVPSASPQAVVIVMSPEHNNTAHLTWEPPPHEAHNGIIQGYQVWCFQSEEQRYQNWTVDSGRHSLDISSLSPGTQYWVSVAAVNGAGVGTPSDRHGFIIDPQPGGSSQTDSLNRDLSHVLSVLRDPVLIGSVGALLWFILMATAVCLFRRHSRPDHLRGHRRAKGLHKLANEDLIIKHRMASPDSPWIPGAWRPTHYNDKYQGLWTQSQEHPVLKSTSLPVTAKKDPGNLDSAVPIVPDSCGVYGTFYVDLTGSSLKTFNSPAHRPKVPHYPPYYLPQQHGIETISISSQPVTRTTLPQQGTETIRISSQPVTRTTATLGNREALPWKLAPRCRPKMGVLKDSWEKNHHKQELHAVNSVPLLTARNQAPPSKTYRQRLSHLPPGGHPERVNLVGSPRILHYSASLHLVDMLPSPPPPPPVEDTSDTLSLTSEEGSSHSTRLTVDAGSLQSVCPVSSHCGPRGSPTTIDTTGCPSYCRLSTTSYCRSLDEHQGATLASQEVTRYLELSPKTERRSAMSEQPCPFSSPSLGYICGPFPSDQLDDNAADDEQVARPTGSPRARLRSTPSSCCSEWEGSLWNSWGSVMEGDVVSARTSLISSVDSSFMNDSNFARVLAGAAESMSGTSFSDFSPPASPLSALFPPGRGEGDCYGDLEPMPVWDWSLAWVEEMEAQYRGHYPRNNTVTFDT